MRFGNKIFIIIYPVSVLLASVSCLIYLVLFAHARLSKPGFDHLNVIYIITRSLKIQFLFLVQVLRIIIFQRSANLSFPEWVKDKLQYSNNSVRVAPPVTKVIGICFLTHTYDTNQLKLNIKFFSKYFKKVILIKNGDVRLDIDLTECEENIEIIIIEEYGLDFQKVL